MPKILVVDDEDRLRENLCEILEINDFEVLQAANGRQGIEIALTRSPDLVISDVMMPEKDGFELCRTLRKSKQTQEMPILLLTARNDHESIIRGFDAGANDYIVKPFRVKELLARIRTHVLLKIRTDQILSYSERLEKANARLNIQQIQIQQKNKDLTESMKYAMRIQEALLSGKEKTADLFADFFVFYRAKDILSGDFYWIHKNAHSVFVAVADCTGHGVPGALLSVLGAMILDQIVSSNQQLTPAFILKKLDSEFQRMLQSENQKQVSADGMDISICQFDFQNQKIYIANANRPVYYFSENKLHTLARKKNPIGGCDLENTQNKQFENIEIPSLRKGDGFYLFSDGYADQLGGTNNDRFQLKNFRKLVSQIAHLPAEEQKKQIEQNFERWKGTNEQVDDVLVVYLKI